MPGRLFDNAWRTFAPAVVLATALCGSAAAQPCTNEWSSVGFGASNGVNSGASAIASVNGALYATGNFTSAGGIAASGIAKWNGTAWSALGGGLVGGTPLVSSIIEWNGSLYAAGRISTADGNAASKIAKWDGSAWSPLDLGLESDVNALAVYNDALYVAGTFAHASFVASTARIAKWDGTTWSPVGTGVDGSGILSLAVYNNLLYVSGSNTFITAGGVSVPDHLAKWDGTNWSAVPATGLNASGTPISPRFTVLNGELYCTFNLTGNISRIAKFDGTQWSLFAGNLTPAGVTLAYFDDGTGGALYAGGSFTQAGTTPVPGRVAKWNGASWSAVGSGTNAILTSLAVFDGALYANAGTNVSPYAPTVNNISRWACDPTGACCLPSGTCELRTQFSCSLDSGTFQGDGIACGSCTPAPTGACCLPNGSCIVTWNAGPGGCLLQNGIYQGNNTTCAAPCPVFESELNNTKATADAFALSSGQNFAGLSTGNTAAADPAGPDYFLVGTAAAPLGIYQHTLTLSTAITGHTAILRGSRQNNAAPSGQWPCDLGTLRPNDDRDLQSGWTSGNNTVLSWHGFGKQEQVYLRVNGTPATVAPYTVTLTSIPVTPTNLGAFAAGNIIITNTLFSQPGTDIAVSVFNANLEPIPGYSNLSATFNGGAPYESPEMAYLKRTYQPGSYYLAVGAGNLRTNLSDPCDDVAGNLAISDFPNIIIPVSGTNQTFPYDVSFEMIDASGSHLVAANIAQRGQIAWYHFTVTGGCAADFNGDNVRDVADLFGYINAWLAKTANADFNHDNVVDVADLFGFINAWLAGC